MTDLIIRYYFFGRRYVKLFFDFRSFVRVCFFLQVMMFRMMGSSRGNSYDKS